jgi:CTP synthase
VAADTCETPEGARRQLAGVDAICVPGGFGVRGIEGKVGALRWAREHQIPTLGLCLGLQCMVIEYARHVAGLPGASSSEFEPGTPYPVIATMAEQQHIVAGEGDLGGTMRLGGYPAVLADGSIARDVYAAAEVTERHRHRYEVNNNYLKQLEAAGLVFSGMSPDRSLGRVRRAAARGAPVLHRHPGAPRVPLTTGPAAPAVRRLVGAAIDRQRAERLVEVEASAAAPA